MRFTSDKCRASRMVRGFKMSIILGTAPFVSDEWTVSTLKMQPCVTSSVHDPI